MKAVGKEEVETLDIAEIVARKLEGAAETASNAFPSSTLHIILMSPALVRGFGTGLCETLPRSDASTCIFWNYCRYRSQTGGRRDPPR